MANSLLTGFSGLATHQKMIEVVGNNLANLNTTGFKSSRVSFADTIYETVNGGSGGVPGVSGGTNPSQIGTGSKLSNVARNLSQGNFDTTSGQFDFALDGDGFFVVNTSSGPAYTRDGSFGVDKNGFLVASSNGNYVQRFGEVGEPSALGPAFQTPGSNNIKVPIGARIPGQATTVANLRGNLAANSASSVLHQLQTDPLTVGGSPATETDLLNSLDLTTSPYTTGDAIEVTGTNFAGDAVTASISVDATTTVQDFMDAIGAQFPNTTLSLDAGQLVVQANEYGVTPLTINLQDAAGNTGAANFLSTPFQTVATGTNGDIVRAGIEVIDEQGAAHIVGLELRKQADGTWSMNANLDSSEGTIIDGEVDGITFASDGSILSSGTSGTGDSQLSILFNGVTTAQDIQINFGDPSTFSGVTSIAGESSMVSEQDGYVAGTIVDFNVSSSGIIEGIADNGRQFSIAQIAIAQFNNPQGMVSGGDNLFRATTSSGTVELGAGLSGGRGSIQSGQLEQSNVDIAVEFSKLIIAQRGFSANARTITVADEILKELTNLGR